MIRWLFLLVLVWSTVTRAQEPPGAEQMASNPASYSVEDRTELDSDKWAQLHLSIDSPEGYPIPRNILLVGFGEVASQSHRPESGARPDYQAVLVEDPESFPFETERWLRRDLVWFVLTSQSMPPDEDSWMSDALNLDAGSVSLELGSPPESREAGGGGDSLPSDSAEAHPRMHWGGLLLLLVLPLGLGWSFGRDREEDAAWTRPMVIQIVVAGVLFVLVSDLWLVGYHLDNEFTSSDLLEYCDGVLTLQGEADAWPAGRSRFAGALPALLAPFGVLDGIRNAALVSTFLVGAGIFSWAWLVGGRVAAWAAVAAALTLGPLTHLPRMLSFYPEIIAVLTWTAVATLWAVHRSTITSVALAGAAMALCCLIDARGLAYAAFFGVGLATWLLVRFRRDAGWPLIVLAIPLVLSWPMGRVAYTAGASSLEAQLDMDPLQAAVELSIEQGTVEVPPDAQTFGTDHVSFVWGRTAPGDFAEALGGLVQAWPRPRAEIERVGGVLTRDAQVDPWLPLLLAVVPLAFWTAWRRKKGAGSIGFALSVLPTVVALPLVMLILIPISDAPSRFLTQLMPALAVCMGLSFEALLRAIPGDGRFDRGARVRWAVIGLVLLSGVAGWLPTPLAPDADWRYSWRAVTEHERLEQMVTEGTEIKEGLPGASCLNAMQSPEAP